jgi:alkanesulfonate monooxygenase SsuD/methylene tetrahydromethanopterin reductase-like flavin-dependent oxidoreductase (luciferase family)
MSDATHPMAPAPGGGGSPALQFGIFDWLDQCPSLEIADVYEQRLQMLEYADRAGYYCYHIAEHHSTPLSRAPSPSVFLAAAAQRTRRLRLGSLVHLLPLYNPLRLIDEICMLDHLSRGRLEIGVGRGIQPWELRLYNIDPQESRAIFREALEVLLMGLRTGRVDYEGQYLTFRDVPVVMRPYQQPYPPLWYPTSSPEIEWVAREGFNTIAGALFSPPRALPERVRTYWQIQREHGHDPQRINAHVREPKYGFACHVYVAETDSEALRVARAAYQDFFANFNWLFALRGDPYVERLREFDPLVEQGLMLVGSPATVRARLQDILTLTGVNYFAGVFAWGSLGTKRIMRSLQLFTEQVVPALRAGNSQPAEGAE